MTNLITAQEAFTAIHNGKTVLCRFAGNRALPADKDFSTLDQVSAMVFVWPDYEFCIQVEMMELAGIKFTKPLTPQDVVDGQEIFIVMPTKILRTQFDVEHDDIRHSVMNGFAQADKENAILQLQAMGAVFGTVIDFIHVVDGFGNPKKLHTQDQAVNDDSSIDDIIGPAGGQTPASFDVEKKTSETKLDDKPKRQRKKKEAPVVIKAESNTDEDDYLDTSDPAIKKFIDGINAASTIYELDNIGISLGELAYKLHPQEVDQIKQLITDKQNQIDKATGDVSVTFLTERLEQASTIAELNDIEMEVENQKLLTPPVADDCDQLLIDIAAKREQINQLSIIEQTDSPQHKAPLTAPLLEKIEAAQTIAELTAISEVIQQAQTDFPHVAKNYNFLKTEIAAKIATIQPSSVSTDTETTDVEAETSDDVAPNPDALFSNMLSSIKVATSETEVFTIRRSFRANGSFTDDQFKELEEACEARLTDLSLDEFDTQPAPEAKTDVFAGAKQSALNAAANFNQTEYESKLVDLIQRAQNAKSVVEANALFRYTRDWTLEQTEPLKKAVQTRLLQLDKTLIERIREAQSPAILNTFLTDIQALTNAVYAHQCMTAYEQRKQQLTQA